MTVFYEGNLQVTFPPNIAARKFDDADHGLTHCMKAVDFIVELDDRFIFIEFKDPQHPNSKNTDGEKWMRRFLSGNLDEDFKLKYRDSFLYTWAMEQIEKPVYYYVLIAFDTLTEAELLTRTDELKRKLPIEGPTGIWKRKIVHGCAVFNIETWNKMLPHIPLSRTAS